MAKKIKKTEILVIRVTKKTSSLLKKASKKNRMSLSAFARGAIVERVIAFDKWGF